jgi:hypothetical protein
MTSFQLRPEEEDTARRFRERHKRLHGPQWTSAVGGAWTYSFTPTSLGALVEIKCCCGKEKVLRQIDG